MLLVENCKDIKQNMCKQWNKLWHIDSEKSA